MREFSARASLLASLLEDVKGFESYKPQGAFYMFPRVSGLLARMGATAEEMVKRLLFTKGVLLLPGSSFPDKAGVEFVRFSFATSRRNIVEGVERIREFVEEFY